MGRTTPAPLLLNCFFSIALRTRVLISPSTLAKIRCSVLDSPTISCQFHGSPCEEPYPTYVRAMPTIVPQREVCPWRYTVFSACSLDANEHAWAILSCYWASGTRLEIYFVVPALRDLYSRDVPTIPLYYCLFKKKIVYWLLHVFLAKFHLELAGSPWNSFWYRTTTTVIHLHV